MSCVLYDFNKHDYIEKFKLLLQKYSVKSLIEPTTQVIAHFDFQISLFAIVFSPGISDDPIPNMA